MSTITKCPKCHVNILIGKRVCPNCAYKLVPESALPGEGFVRSMPCSAASAWQPIETLPRDGTRVLVWAEPIHEPDIAWHEETGSTLRTYTHWMALPKPPNVRMTYALAETSTNTTDAPQK